MADMFDNIPAELRGVRQWINWRYEATDAGKPTKVPVDPSSGYPAATDNPATWSTFEHAVHNARAQLVNGGIGFVFTPNDPFAGVDLDSPVDGKRSQDEVDAIYTRHWRMVQTFNSYTELSPSGNGAHIIVRARVPNGKRRECVELYSSGRFFTFTGNVYNNAPIVDAQAKAEILWNELGGDRQEHVGAAWNGPQTQDDNDLLSAAMQAANGQLFAQLWTGNFTGYPSQSEADQALVNILCFYSNNREQVARLFLASGLGQRDKAKRQDYREATISKGFDQKIALMDLSQLQAAAKRAVDQKLAQPRPIILPNMMANETERPDGLLGEIADFIYASSPRPVPEVSLMGAIALMAGICGRSYMVNGAGLNQYLLLLADTGRGKEAMSQGINHLMSAVAKPLNGAASASDIGFHSALKFLGPSELSSAPAILKHLQEQPSFVSIIGEFGLRLKKWAGDRANANDIAVRMTLLDLYGKSGRGNSMREIVYSDRKENTKAVERPALSILGESTSMRFLDVIDENMISEGFLPRFLTIEYEGPRPPLQEGHDKVVPSVELLSRLRDVCAASMKALHENTWRDVRIEPEAMAFLREFDTFCDECINSQRGQDVQNQLWSRAYMKLLKLAALYAVGENYLAPALTLKHAMWAKKLVVRDIERMVRRFEAGETGGAVSDTNQEKEIMRVCSSYFRQHHDTLKKYGATDEHIQNRQIPFVYISRRLAPSAAFRHDRMGATFAINRALRNLVDQGRLRELRATPNPNAPPIRSEGARVFLLLDVSVLD